MNDTKTMRTGVIGTALAAVCCFTPLLVILFGIAGLTAWLGWIDYALFPVMFASLGLVAQALYMRAGSAGPNPKPYIAAAVIFLSALLFWLEFRYALRLTLAAAAAVAAYAYYLRGMSTQNQTPRLPE